MLIGVRAPVKNTYSLGYSCIRQGGSLLLQLHFCFDLLLQPNLTFKVTQNFVELGPNFFLLLIFIFINKYLQLTFNHFFNQGIFILESSFS